ncbi:MAG TPA: DNA-binding domain-containing protein [Allosphingosinicella sp.]
MAEPGLAELQLWTHKAILRGGANPDTAEALIRESGALRPEARLAIYAEGYKARLIESLGGEFPALKCLVGESVFALFATGYIAARPPGHFSLYALGAGFADHLEATKPPGEETALPAQLARLERARAEVQRAEGLERLGDGVIAAGSALTPGLRLRVPDSVRLLRLGFDFRPLIAAADAGDPPVVPERREAWLAVARMGYRVALHALEPWRFAWLEALGPDGAAAEVAAAAAARATDREVGATLADLALWQPAAARLGLVATA